MHRRTIPAGTEWQPNAMPRPAAKDTAEGNLLPAKLMCDAGLEAIMVERAKQKSPGWIVQV